MLFLVIVIKIVSQSISRKHASSVNIVLSVKSAHFREFLGSHNTQFSGCFDTCYIY